MKHKGIDRNKSVRRPSCPPPIPPSPFHHIIIGLSTFPSPSLRSNANRLRSRPIHQKPSVENRNQLAAVPIRKFPTATGNTPGPADVSNARRSPVDARPPGTEPGRRSAGGGRRRRRGRSCQRDLQMVLMLGRAAGRGRRHRRRRSGRQKELVLEVVEVGGATTTGSRRQVRTVQVRGGVQEGAVGRGGTVRESALPVRLTVVVQVAVQDRSGRGVLKGELRNLRLESLEESCFWSDSPRFRGCRAASRTRATGSSGRVCSESPR